MKLVRYGAMGAEKPGLLDSQGKVRDLSAHVKDIDGAALQPDVLARLSKLDPAALPLVDNPGRLGCPVGKVGKYIAIGLNYRDHAIEAKMPIPTEPQTFLKAQSCICGPNDDVIIPPESTKLDWEVELAFFIGVGGKNIREEDAMKHIAGYSITNDISERQFQLERGTQWGKGKSCDTFGPTGPFLATVDEIPDPHNLDIWLDLNGKRMQTGNTSSMIFQLPKLVSYISMFMSLQPGDMFGTATPPGVGMGRNPQVFLKEGDVMTMGIQGLGEMRQRVSRMPGQA